MSSVRKFRKVKENASAGKWYARSHCEKRDADPTVEHESCGDIGMVWVAGSRGATRADPFFCLVCSGLNSFSHREPRVEECKARSSPVASLKKMLSDRP